MLIDFLDAGLSQTSNLKQTKKEKQLFGLVGDIEPWGMQAGWKAESCRCLFFYFY